MRILLTVKFPLEPFNSMARAGTAGSTLKAILEDLKPEAAYFYAPEGCRGGTFVLDIDSPSQLPSIAEPFFLKFAAKCEVQIAMSPADLEQAGLEQLAGKWG